jgi:hypothetical protein
MSYDVEIGTHREPSPAQVKAWAAGQGLAVEPNGDELLIGEMISFAGPYAAEPEDFAEEIAAACLAPRWMTTVAVSYAEPKRAITLVRSLARHLAEINEGAAFDPQKDALIWPRGSPRRVAPRRREETTDVIRLTWILAPQRWEAAPSTLLDLIRRRCPEALPARYGRTEPLEHRFDPADPEPFIRFVLDPDEDDGFWFAARPSFGGRWLAPHADPYEKPDAEHLRVGRLEIRFDGAVLETDARWRESVVDLFKAAASGLGAFFAAAQVEPDWTVTANNRIYASWKTMKQSGEYFLQGRLWQGLSPVPLWLSWFGGPYRDLLAPHLTHEAFDGARPPRGRIRSLLKRREPIESRIESRPDGLFVRLGEEPRPVGELGAWPLPPELCYRHRPPVTRRGGVLETDAAKPGDEAAVIPDLTR